MADLAIDILTYIKDKNLVTDLGVDAFRDYMPDAPAQCIALNEYSTAPGRFHDAALARNFQVEVRGQNKASTRNLCWAIYELFDVEDNIITLANDRYGCVSLKQTPGLIKQDDQGRSHYAFNMSVVSTKDNL